MVLTDTELAQILTDLKYLSPAKLQAAQQKATEQHQELYEALVEEDYLNEEELSKVIAYHYQLPYTSLRNINIPLELLRLLPKSVAQRFQTIPFELTDSALHIATAHPEANDVYTMLAKKAGVKQYILSYSPETEIIAALHLYKPQLSTILSDLLTQAEATTPPINGIIDNIFEYADDSRASDIHIEPQKEETIIRFRIDGVLHDQAGLPKKLHEQIVSRLKVMARLRTDEHLSAQDGRLHLSDKTSTEGITVRISIVPVITGEKVVMRLLAKHTRQFSLTELGMSNADLAKVRKGFSRPFGMILSTGPTGSGKTTTIYAVLKILNTRDRNIATIEDPVEYVIGGINQIQANAKTNLTFSNGLRSLLRQDPDILFVGEIRDEETADIAVNAAMTGHLVLSTMHTNDAVTTLPRLIDMHIEPFLAASTVNVIVGQRLVRQICGHCKTSAELVKTSGGWKGDDVQAALLTSIDQRLVLKYFGRKTSVRVYYGTGCSACHDTGYQGRFGIFEVLEITPAIAQLIVAKADSRVMANQAIKEGMVTMFEDGLQKVITGKTTLAEILRVTKG
jgi:type II secretory ATPase GspE/PulE/Tfp pilus assembly ATPase PilB-like protein